ncbi:MAG: hypothetical protein SWK90_07510 [Chloroflexota bacterium]|nr:hypothetical protein [Chloroflexota bacterium]
MKRLVSLLNIVLVLGLITAGCATTPAVVEKEVEVTVEVEKEVVVEAPMEVEVITATPTPVIVEELPALIPSTTKMLDETMMQYLSISDDGAVLTFSEARPELVSLSEGDIIVSDKTSIAPDGFLRKVTNVSMSGDQVIVETIQATLDEAIEQGTIDFSTVLTPADVGAATQREGVALAKARCAPAFEGFSIVIDTVLEDEDGDLETTDDQIRAKGQIDFVPHFDFKVKIKDFELKQITFVNRTTERVQLELETKVEIVDIHRKVEIAHYSFAPQTIWVGWVPIVITPELAVYVGLDGNVSVGITTSVTQEATLTAGLTYDNGGWSPMDDLQNEFQFAPPSLSTNCGVRVYAGPQLSLLIYGTAGPYGEIDGYLKLAADPLDTPWWKLYGGLKAEVGIEVKVLSHIVASHKDTVIDYEKILAQAESFTPTHTPDPTPTPTPTPCTSIWWPPRCWPWWLWIVALLVGLGILGSLFGEE